jgi:hypothetical protein
LSSKEDDPLNELLGIIGIDDGGIDVGDVSAEGTSTTEVEAEQPMNVEVEAAPVVVEEEVELPDEPPHIETWALFAQIRSILQETGALTAQELVDKLHEVQFTLVCCVMLDCI